MSANRSRNAVILQSALVYDGWYKLYRLAVQMPCGAVVERHVEDHGSAVCVLPYDPERRCALVVSLPRPPLLWTGSAPLLEAIAGNLDGDTPAEAATREALEEAGVRLAELEPLATIWSLPSLSTERVFLFLSPYAQHQHIGLGGGCSDEAESVTAHEIALPLLAEMADRNELGDPKLLILVQSLRLRRPELFTPILPPEAAA
ncbi:NUDIX domain-containing protein [Sphingomonas tabacisoli]|uniref:NUDIX domain-containing protein n=1 Tax=Sphingomonas tabacisoli TaxID=2249466 RepID=A0ABW4I5Y8_9SPHN